MYTIMKTTQNFLWKKGPIIANTKMAAGKLKKFSLILNKHYKLIITVYTACCSYIVKLCLELYNIQSNRRKKKL